MRYLFFLLVLLCFGCTSTKGVEYSFFTAGHTYGNPQLKGKEKGLYEPFKDKFTFINNQPNLELGFLLGDVVWGPKSWPEAQNDIAKLNMPVHIARGNHDGPLKQFEEKFGESYKRFFKNNDLFIVLDPNIDHWNITNEQLVFLKNTLRNDAKKANHVFIMMHQVIWWTNREYAKPFPNSIHGKSKQVNYWTKIEPLLQELGKPVYLFAGDVGAFSKEHRKKNHIIEYFYNKDRNVTYISTGMGGGVRDNFVITDINKDGSVSFRLVHLNGDDLNGLGRLEDYKNPN